MNIKKITFFTLVLAFLGGCVGANTKGISETFLSNGAIWYKEVKAESHNFEIHMYENKVGALDAYGINTSTSEERLWIAKDTFGFIPTLGSPKEYPVCKSPIKVVNESSYQVKNHPKRWLNTTWWVLYVRCDDVNPHYIG